MKTALELIANERQRQIEEEGYTTEHDDFHRFGELAMAAAVYAAPPRMRGVFNLHKLWPWNWIFWKATPKDRIRELVKSGALIVAEIERLQRKEGNYEA